VTARISSIADCAAEFADPLARACATIRALRNVRRQRGAARNRPAHPGRTVTSRSSAAAAAARARCCPDRAGTIDAGTIGFGEKTRPEDVRVMFRSRGCCPGRGVSNVEVGRPTGASADAQARADKALGEVGLDDTANAAVLSGGQKQRVALARAGQRYPRAGVRRAARRARCLTRFPCSGCWSGLAHQASRRSWYHECRKRWRWPIACW